MSPESAKASYRRSLNETVTIRRYTGTGTGRPRFDADARARVVGYAPHELLAGSGLVQGDRKVILYADDLIENGLTLPVTVNDKAVVRGKELAIMAADDSTRRVDGVLVAYEIQVRG